MSDPRPPYTVVLEPEPPSGPWKPWHNVPAIVRLRKFLKQIKREAGLRCTLVAPADSPHSKAPPTPQEDQTCP